MSTNSLPALTGVGHQWMGEYQYWLPPVNGRVPTLVATSGSHWLNRILKVAPAGRYRSLVANTSKCGWVVTYLYRQSFSASHNITKHSRSVHTMNYEVRLGRCQRVNWLLNSSWEHFSLHYKKDGKGTMKVEVPKIQLSRHNKCSDMVQRVLRWKRQKRRYGRKRQGPMQEICHYNYFLMNLFGGFMYNTTPRQRLPRHNFQHLYDVMHLEKQAHPLYA